MRVFFKDLTIVVKDLILWNTSQLLASVFTTYNDTSIIREHNMKTSHFYCNQTLSKKCFVLLFPKAVCNFQSIHWWCDDPPSPFEHSFSVITRALHGFLLKYLFYQSSHFLCKLQEGNSVVEMHYPLLSP